MLDSKHFRVLIEMKENCITYFEISFSYALGFTVQFGWQIGQQVLEILKVNAASYYMYV